MRMFVGIAAALVLAGGVAVAAARVAQHAPPGVWVSKDGDQVAIAATDPSEDFAVRADDEALGDRVRQLAVLAGRGAQLGVSVRDLDADQAKGQSGAVVEDVRAGSAAEKAGIKKGDVITAFDGENVRGVRHLTRLVSETPEGRTVNASVMRDGKRVDVAVTPDAGNRASLERNFDVLVPPMRFEKRPHSDDDLAWAMPGGRGGAWMFKGGRPGEVFGFTREKGRLGIKIQALDGQLAEYFGTATGVLVNSVEAGSPAAKAGLKAGDVVTAIDGKSVTEPSEVIEAVRGVKDGATLTLSYTRDKKAHSATATLDKAPAAEQPRKRHRVSPL